MGSVKKRITDLRAGEKFKAIVTDCKQNELTIQFEDGASLTARMLTTPQVHIGDEAVFLVKDNADGRLTIEFANKSEDTQGQNNPPIFDMRA